MNQQPEKILLVTERPLLALNFRELLDSAGWDNTPIVLRPEELEPSLALDTAALAVIDSEAGVSWTSLRALCEQRPLSRFVIWCTVASPRLAQAAMEAGVHGLLSLRLAPAEAAQALVQVWRGERQFRFNGDLQVRATNEPGLTPREQQVVALVIEGRRNREIAEALHTTEGSIKVYLNRIFWKTGAKNRHELAAAGLSFKRRPETASSRHIAASTADPFDALWMFTGGQPDFRTSGEARYDSTKR